MHSLLDIEITLTDRALRPQVRDSNAATSRTRGSRSVSRSPLPRTRLHGYHARMSSRTWPLWTETLPDPLPANPLQVAAEWLAQARADASQPNPNSMVLATVDRSGQPSARVVLCKEIDWRLGHIVFYTNYRSRKGRDLEANPRAAVVFHWDHRHRQVRAEGRVEPLADADNDAYFQTRPWQSRIGAWASRQSEPVASRAQLGKNVAEAAHRFGIDYGTPGSQEPEIVPVQIPRPDYWGGYRLVVAALELWVEGEFRIHDRARWTRTSGATEGRGASGGGSPAGNEPDAWTVTRLQP
jgi:pyridoxamine 5'-phosphate oxidase